jgi:hypothetical protein
MHFGYSAGRFVKYFTMYDPDLMPLGVGAVSLFIVEES